MSAAALRRIGYRVTVRSVTDTEDGALYFRPRRVQLLRFSWTAEHPSPANFFTSFFRCGADVVSSFPCDRVVDRALDRGLAAASSDPAAAARRWTALDRLAVDRALLVPLRNPSIWTFVSSRVGNSRANPMFGPLLDQLWVR